MRLVNLDKKYRKKQFDTDDPGQIKSWIYKQLQINSQYIDHYSPKREELQKIKEMSSVFHGFTNFLRLRLRAASRFSPCLIFGTKRYR